MPLPAQSQSARYLLFVVHGSGDAPADWPADFIEGVEETVAHREQWDVIAYDWSRYAEDKATASQAGIEIGKHVGAALASAEYRYERIQFVAHSVGAFVAQAACDAYRETRADNTRIHLALLDPFTGNGLIDWTYGTRRFGEGADFAEAYINTDDPVPSTNGALDKAHTFDVTAQAPQSLSGRDRHWWPVYFYIESIDTEDMQFGYPLSLMATGESAPTTHEQFPRGQTTMVP